MYTLAVEGTFDAAHYLVDYDGQCANVHGHTWRVVAEFEYMNTNDLGMAQDFGELKKALSGVLDKWDHSDLNESFNGGEWNPTAENIAYSVYASLQMLGLPVSAVTVWEAASSSVRYSTD